MASCRCPGVAAPFAKTILTCRLDKTVICPVNKVIGRYAPQAVYRAVLYVCQLTVLIQQMVVCHEDVYSAVVLHNTRISTEILRDQRVVLVGFFVACRKIYIVEFVCHFCEIHLYLDFREFVYLSENKVL